MEIDRGTPAWDIGILIRKGEKTFTRGVYGASSIVNNLSSFMTASQRP
jgi:hypothetical protein